MFSNFENNYNFKKCFFKVKEMFFQMLKLMFFNKKKRI